MCSMISAGTLVDNFSNNRDVLKLFFGEKDSKTTVFL